MRLTSRRWVTLGLVWLNAANSRIVVGAMRPRGHEGVVVENIPGPSDVGLGRVRVEREEWPAESTNGQRIAAGTRVRIAEVRGIRVMVTPIGTYTPGYGARP